MSISLRRNGLNFIHLLKKFVKKYFEPPFPIRIKEHAKATTVVYKSNIKTPRPSEQIKVEPNIAMVNDLLVDSIDGHVIYFYKEATRIAK
jgi:hypothetical protein